MQKDLPFYKIALTSNMYHQFLNRIRTRSLLWDTITTTGWSTAAKALGFLIPFFIAAWFGVSAETDAFFFSYGLILFLSSVFAQVVESVIVPYISEARAKNDDVGKFVGNILGAFSVGLSVLMGVVLLCIKPVMAILTKFDPHALNLIYRLLVESTPLVILLFWSSVLVGTLNTYGKFAFPAISPAFRAIVNLIIIYLFKDVLGVHAIVIGYVGGEIIRLISLLLIIIRLKLVHLLISIQFHSRLWKFLKTASYQAIGMVAVGLNPIIDQAMASWLGEGNVSVLSYADRLYMIPISVLVAGLFPVILSHWSKGYYQNEDREWLLQQVKKSVKLVFIVTLAVSIFFIIFSRPLVFLAFARGKFDLSLMDTLQVSFICYLLGLIPYVTGSMFTRAHLVLKNTRILMKLAILNCIMNMLLNYFLMHVFGVAGIALSTSVTTAVIAILLFLSFSQIKKGLLNNGL